MIVCQDYEKLQRPVETFYTKYVLDCMCIIALPSLPKSHIYYPFPFPFGAVSQSYLRYCLSGSSPYFTPIKLNLQLLHCEFCFSVDV